MILESLIDKNGKPSRNKLFSFRVNQEEFDTLSEIYQKREKIGKSANQGECLRQILFAGLNEEVKFNNYLKNNNND